MRISSLRSIANVANPFHSLDYFCLNLCPFCFVVRAAICFVGLRLVEIRFIFLDFGLCSAFIVFRQNVVLSQIRALCCNHLSVILTPKRTCYCNVNKSQLKTSVCSGFWTVVRTNGSTNAFLVINGINFMVTATDDIKAKKNSLFKQRNGTEHLTRHN